MKNLVKKSFLLLALFSATVAFTAKASEKSYLVSIDVDKNKVVSASVANETKNIKTEKIKMNLPKGADPKEVFQKLILDNSPEYILQEKNELKDIFPWKFKMGSSYRITYKKGGSVSSEKIETEKKSEKIKNYFYLLYFLVLAIIFFSVLEEWVSELKKNKSVALMFLTIAVAGIVAISASVAEAAVAIVAVAVAIVVARATKAVGGGVLARTVTAVAVSVSVVGAGAAVEKVGIVGAVGISDTVIFKIFTSYFVLIGTELLLFIFFLLRRQSQLD